MAPRQSSVLTGGWCRCATQRRHRRVFVATKLLASRSERAEPQKSVASFHEMNLRRSAFNATSFTQHERGQQQAVKLTRA